MASASTRRLIDFSLAWLLLAAALAPLLALHGLLYPHVATKVAYFDTVVELAAALLLLKAARGEVAFPQALRRPWAWLPLSFLGVAYLSSLFGIDFENSFYSTLARSDGLLTLTHFVAYFYLLVFAFRRADWEKLLALLALEGGIVALAAVAQIAGVPGMALPSIPGRADALIGNAELSAGFLVIALFLALARSLKVNARRRVRYAWGALVVLDLVGIALTGTRGAIVALALATLASAILVAIFSGSLKVRLAAFGFLLLLAGGAVGAYALRDSFQKSEMLLIRRMASISLNDATTRSRLYLWEHSLATAKERPLLGFGSQNEAFAINAAYDPSYVEEGWLDRSHNVYVDYLVENGALGLVAYLALYAMFARFAYARRKRESREAFALVLLLVAYAAQNFFAFDSISSSIAFWALLGYVLATSEESETRPRRPEVVRARRAFRALAGVAACVVVASSYWAVYKPIRANAAMAESFRQHDAGDALRLARESIAYAPGDIELGSLSFSLYLSVAHQQKVSLEDKMRFYEFAYGELDALSLDHPWHAKPYLLKANLMLERPKGESFDEDTYEQALTKAIALGPKRAEGYYLRVRHVLETHNPPRREDYLASVHILEEYVELVPHLAKPRLLIARFLLSAGEKEKAASAFARGLALYTPEPELAQDVIDYYLALGDYRNAEEYFAYLRAEYPRDPQRTLDLAKIQAINGKTEEAVRLVRALIESDSNAAALDPAFVRSILGAGHSPATP